MPKLRKPCIISVSGYMQKVFVFYFNGSLSRDSEKTEYMHKNECMAAHVFVHVIKFNGYGFINQHDNAVKEKNRLYSELFIPSLSRKSKGRPLEGADGFKMAERKDIA